MVNSTWLLASENTITF